MTRAAVAFALLLGLVPEAGPAESGVFRCFGADGSVRFVDSPHACPGGAAERHAPDVRLQRVPTPPPARADEGAAEPLPGLGAVWLTAREIGPGWDVVREAPVDPSGDPDLVAWGVQAQDARHYTRDTQGTIQVCSVEIWSFASPAQARAAHQGFKHPGWRIERAASRVLMLRGLTLEPGSPPRRGLFADCNGIGDRIRQRADQAR